MSEQSGFLRRAFIAAAAAALASAMPVAALAQVDPPAAAQEEPPAAVEQRPAANTPAAEAEPAVEAETVIVDPRPAIHAAGGPESVADLAEDLLDAVVNISTTQRVAASQRSAPAPELPEGSPFQDFFDEFFNREGPQIGPPNQRVQSLGSGFVIDPSGIIITNNHVIDGADEIAANFNDGTRLIATVIGVDTKTDLAVLQVNPVRPLKALRFGDSASLRVGDWVMAIGNPFGLGGTVTIGILSARNRDINSGPYDDFLQTDAAINRGNSGGPLFNMRGEVVGINTAIISPTGGSIGIGFAVPTEIAERVIGQLREFGHTNRGWLGVRIQQVTDEIAEGLAMEIPHGALIAGVTEDGPAAKAGIRPGDVVLQFDGRRVAEMRDLPRMVADTDIDKVVPVVVLRQGKEETIEVTVGRLDEGETQVAAAGASPEESVGDVRAETLGLTLADLTPDLRTQFGIAEEVSGVLVTEVAEGSPAAEKQVQPGDVIVEVAQEPVQNPDEVDARIAELKTDKRRVALLLLADKTGEFRFVSVRIGG